ncbi:Non-specific serine/threonine protein kinase [Bertholletia excelsa]
MCNKRCSFVRMARIRCCCCFGFSFARKLKSLLRPKRGIGNHPSQESLLTEGLEDEGDCSYRGYTTENEQGDDVDIQSMAKRSEDILMCRIKHGLICREFPVKETSQLVRAVDASGNKMVNEYIHELKIGSGSYGKVVLYRSSVDGKQYAMKVFHKSYLSKLHVSPGETAMTDVLREVLIMKMLDHPNIVKLIEVINDPTADHFYMVLEYVEGKWVREGSGPSDGLGEDKAQKYLQDIVSGLMYLHAHNVIHGDIKPDNLLVTADGTVKIGDYSVSQVFEGDNDELSRTPGTPVFTAPECCLGQTYHGKAADTWAVGVTLYYMVFGKYPFLGDTLQDTYDKIVNDPLSLPGHVNPLLKNLIEGLLCKDPRQRMTLEDVASHAWVNLEGGAIPKYLCWHKLKRLQSEGFDESCRETLVSEGFQYPL